MTSFVSQNQTYFIRCLPGLSAHVLLEGDKKYFTSIKIMQGKGNHNSFAIITFSTSDNL